MEAIRKLNNKGNMNNDGSSSTEEQEHCFHEAVMVLAHEVQMQRQSIR